jgi:hypothetical protein
MTEKVGLGGHSYKKFGWLNARAPREALLKSPTCSQCRVLTSPRYLGLRSIYRVWSRGKSQVAKNDLQGTLELLCMR